MSNSLDLKLDLMLQDKPKALPQGLGILTKEDGWHIQLENGFKLTKEN